MAFGLCGQSNAKPFGVTPTSDRDAMTTQAEFFQAHAVDGQLTDAQMLQLLQLPEGDTGTTPDSGEPDTAADGSVQADNETKNQNQPAMDADPDPAKAVVMAKDGVHTIPYQKLVEARDGAQQWRAQAEAAQSELAALKAAAEQRADAGEAPTRTDAQAATAEAAIDAGVDPAIFGDFSEGDLAKGIKSLVDMQAKSINAAVEKRLAEMLGPVLEQQKTKAADSHYGSIYERHPDADSIAESKELADWIGKQPTFARAGYQAVLSQGSTGEIIEFFDTFKAATGKTTTPATTGKQDVAAAARAAIASAKSAVPASLSDFPGGSAGPADEMDAMRQMGGQDLMAKLEGKSPEQIEALMARLI